MRIRIGAVISLVGLNLFVAAWAAEPASGPEILVTTDHPDAVYQLGQPIQWRVEVRGEASTNSVLADYTLKKGGLTLLREGKLSLTNGVGQLEAELKESGTLLLEVKLEGSDTPTRPGYGGAIVAPEGIRPAAARPPDFDAFWASKIEELSKVPANPQLTPGESGKPGVDYWQVTMDNIRGSHIRGQLARPASGDKFPALLLVQWAGVYPLQKAWASERAASGWLVLNINAHDLPIDEAASFYDAQSRGALKDYPAIGNDNRDASYFLRMYLSCYRAVQYLTERPDWDGKILVVAGTSQGGQQTLMTAGFHPRVTAAIACVPAGCDLAGPQVGRSPGWPAWCYKTEGKDPAKVIEASRYYDVVNFASRIKCPVLVGIGLIDETCPPAGVVAALNQVQGTKEIVFLPHSDHQGAHNSQQPFRDRENVWLAALREGRAVPAAKH